MPTPRPLASGCDVGAELRLIADEGPLSLIFGHASEIIGWLATPLHGSR